MLTRHIALVSKTAKIKTSDLNTVAAALQKQAIRDLGPIWEIQATVDPFEKLKDVPPGYWPIVIKEKIDDDDLLGYHTDKFRQPFALVAYEKDSWPITCSHEMCEMLVDPFGVLMVASGSIKPDQGRVQYLVEVCDPSEADQFAYSVNGILLSDFYTPNYFDPVVASGVRYSYTGCIKKPKEVLKGGYLTWLDPSTGLWWQANRFNGRLTFEDITREMGRLEGSLRGRVDRITRTPRLVEGVSQHYKDTNKKHRLNQASAGRRIASHWEQEIGRLER